ncbi:MAG TPA: hypothetical protein VIA18_17470, partial [Polyangia bacterium]|nr:hypothetical protein [Polyangia bacterium]
MDVVAWLLEGDPAVRWQALRDLTDATPAEVAEARARVAGDGLGAQLLSRQHADGAWHRGDDDATWYPTLHALLLLRATGVDPTDARVATALRRLDDGFRWAPEFGSGRFFAGEVEPCINGGVLALGAYFGHADAALVAHLLADQLPDGGWNCDAPKSTCGSFHS